VPIGSIILLSFIAQAATPNLAADKKAAARELLVDGQALYEKGDFAGALRKFDDAYATFPSPKIWINIGNANMNLGRNVESLDAFDNFLRFGADEPADKRDYADKQVAKLKRNLGQLSIECNVVGAEIALDGKKIGVTPLTAWTTAGQHNVVAICPNAEPSTQKIEVSAGKPQLVQLRLQPIQARPTPSAASVASPNWADSSQVHAAGAKRLYEAGDYAGAIGEMEAERRLNPDPNILYNIGQAYRRWGMREQAIIAYRKYLDQVPQADNRPQVERHIADMQAALGIVKGSSTPPVQPAQQTAPTKTTTTAQAHARKASLLYQAGSFAEAITELEAEYLLDGDPAVLYNLGQAYRLWGKVEQSMRAYRQYLAQLPQASNRQQVERLLGELQDTLTRTRAASPVGR
jgi:tetratricopeptide (TPR) repeat protein